ncbi:hypothetical protein PMAYCL1PPCAC_21481, partial [Pristionchus mayeri]
IRVGLTHLLTVIAFPLQLLGWMAICHGEATFFIPLIPTIIVHVLYYHKVFRRGEKRFTWHFFLSQVVITAIQFVLFIIDFDVTRYVIVPLFVQFATCISLYMYNKQINGGNDSGSVRNFGIFSALSFRYISLDSVPNGDSDLALTIAIFTIFCTMKRLAEIRILNS